MALQPFERFVPISRAPQSFFHPSWEVQPWQEFGYHNFVAHMEGQFREMERQMDDMFKRFQQLAPIDRGAEQWRIDNPVVTERDGSKKLKLQFDVRQFKPEEITLKTQDNLLTVHAKHQESSDTNQVHREYQRSITLPQGVQAETLKSILSPEGVLCIEAPVPKAIEARTEKLIPIEHLPSKR